MEIGGGCKDNVRGNHHWRGRCRWKPEAGFCSGFATVPVAGFWKL